MTLGNEPYFSNGFKDLIVWQKAKDLTKGIYAEFKDCRDYGFRDQIQRASVSIMNNVAEGFDRNNKKELKHFLQIAKGSSGEVGSMLELAVELRYIGQDTYLSLSDILGHVRRLLVSFIRSVRLKIK